MRIPIIVVILLASVSCSSTRPSTTSLAVKFGPVITRIMARSEVIVVRCGSDGPTYSLESNSGEIFVSARTLDELAISNPDLAHAVREMQAGVVWAGL